MSMSPTHLPQSSPTHPTPSHGRGTWIQGKMASARGHWTQWWQTQTTFQISLLVWTFLSYAAFLTCHLAECSFPKQCTGMPREEKSFKVANVLLVNPDKALSLHHSEVWFNDFLFLRLVWRARGKNRNSFAFVVCSFVLRKCSQAFLIKVYCSLFCNFQAFKKSVLVQTVAEDESHPREGPQLALELENVDCCTRTLFARGAFVEKNWWWKALAWGRARLWWGHGERMPSSAEVGAGDSSQECGLGQRPWDRRKGAVHLPGTLEVFGGVGFRRLLHSFMLLQAQALGEKNRLLSSPGYERAKPGVNLAHPTLAKAYHNSKHS